MIKNYLKIAERNLLRNKNYTFINISGLTLGIIITLIIALWINDELSYNKNCANYDTVAKVYRKNNGGMISQIVTTGMGTQLKEDYGIHFKHMALLRQRLEQRVLSYEEKKFNEGGYFVQEEGPKIFALDMISGTRSGLADLHSILLSEKLAKKLFGNQNPLDKTVKFENRWELKVTGVYKDLPQNSELNDASYFAPLDLYLHGWSGLRVWDNYNMRLYVQINDGESFESINKIIKDSMIPHVSRLEADLNLELFLHPMSRWNLFSKFENGKSVYSDKLLMILFLGVIGLLILALAIINFINLNTACSEKRIKEIGIRKTLGSTRINFIFQFLGEPFLITSTSVVIALFAAELIIPLLTNLLGKSLSIPWNNPLAWGSISILTIVVALCAGIYPALFLSSFKPSKALKGSIGSGKLAALPRQILVVFQFSVSIILVVAALIIYQQIEFVKDRPLGYDKEGLLYIKARIANKQYEVLKTELIKSGAVTTTARSNYSLTNNRGWNSGFDWPGKDPNFTMSFNIIKSTVEYGKTIGFNLVSGRDFSADLASDSSSVMLNVSSVRAMGLSNPIGKILSVENSDFKFGNYKIIGVVTDIVKGSPYDAPPPALFFIDQNDPRFMYLRLNPKQNASASLVIIRKVFEEVMPEVPFDYEFVDEIYNAKFNSEVQLARLAGTASLLAIVISCLGLFGLTVFLIETKTREIGIRKVIGASVPSIMKLLTSSFAKWILVANIFAWPIGYLMMSSWIQNFKYHAELSLLPFIIAGTGALVIAIVTVSVKTYQAATANPVESLRNE